jgi:stage V sporulation protein B
MLLPRYGIIGYIITVYFTETVNATLSITKLLCATKIKFKIFDWIVKPIMGIICATSATAFILYNLNTYAENRLEIALHIVIITVIYLTILILLKAISPKGIKKAIKNFLSA